MPSIDDIMKAAQGVQAEMAKAQAKLDTLEVEGASGGGMVKVRATAKGRILNVAMVAQAVVSAWLESLAKGKRKN